jgi:L-ascorbate metabolism protein UlaG (beta-lactamase superfamily)
MEITWFGHSCFRLRSKEVIGVIDPFQKSVGYAPLKLTADFVLVSHDHPGHNNVDGVGGSPRVLIGPGEYEIKSIPIVGIQTAHDGEGGRRRGRNVVWIVEMDEVRLAHLGDLGGPLTTDQVEQMGRIDVLCLPVGVHNGLNIAQSLETAIQLEPRIVIPMHFHNESRTATTPLETVDAFLREQGASGVVPQSRLTVTKASLPEEPQTVLLDFRRGS